MVTWEGFYPPSLPPDSQFFYEYVTDARGKVWLFYYDPYEAWRWESFTAEYCVFIEGPAKLVGKPMFLLDWQIGLQREMYGWKIVDIETGEHTERRRYQDVWAFVCKKNNKTTFSVVNALAMLKLDELIQAQIYYFCETMEQAEDSGWRIATGMVKAEAGKLREEYIAREDRIIHVPSQSQLRLVSGSSENLDGKNVQGAIEDEFWRRRSKQAVNQLRTGSIARMNPMFLHISTFGNDKTSSAYKDYLRCKQIQKGEIIEPRTLVVIYEAPEDADPHDRKIWPLANPGWGVTVNADTMEVIYQESLESEATFAQFQQYHVGMWPSGSQAFVRDAEWGRCRREYTEEDLIGMVCYLAGDFADKRDMNALAACFPMWDPEREGNIIYKLLLWYWVAETFEKEKAANDLRYSSWIDGGFLFRTPGYTTDHRIIRNFGRHVLKEKFQIEKVAQDPRFAASVVNEWLDSDEYRLWGEAGDPVDTERVVIVPPGVRGMGVALDGFHRDILEGNVHHNGHPILDWNRGNARVRMVEGVPMLSKNSSTGKIDGMHAAAMAHLLAKQAGPSVQESGGFEERGLFII